ncbi:hypothetical protein VTN00DRAFT_6038 [Thermoascus crustaceus]|uniref:uncharacterized protein n=1 Tax=Thermoascus crustaceus TaxID=5088 RepID=UPI0037438667
MQGRGSVEMVYLPSHIVVETVSLSSLHTSIAVEGKMTGTRSGKAEKEHNQTVDRSVLFAIIHIKTMPLIEKETPRLRYEPGRIH